MELDVFRYIVGVKINGNDHPKALTNVLISAEAIYDNLLLHYAQSTENHIFIYLFDANKNVNIKEYDSDMDRC